MNGIKIVTERLVLVPLGVDYLDSVNEYALDYENTKYMCHLPKRDSDETLSFLQDVESEWKKDSPGYYEFAVLYENDHIGSVSVYFEDGIGELGWIIKRKYWGSGFATEAAKGLVEYFSQRGCRRFIAHCDTENVASYRVMEKLGMTRTGRSGGRKNRAASEESFEYRYELIL